MTSRLLNAAIMTVGSAVIAGCSGSPVLSPTRPPDTVDLAIDVRRAADAMLEFFGSEVHARLTGDGWSAEWIVPEGKTSTPVPSGAVRLDVWTVVRGDTVECTSDSTTGQESCTRPIIGNGQTCSLTMDLAPETQVSVQFRLLVQERCELVPIGQEVGRSLGGG